MHIRFASPLIALSLLMSGAAAAMTYEEAAASGISPVTGSEMLDCALYWEAWADSLNPDHYGEGSGIWDAGWVASLNPDIQLPAARETSEYWYEKGKSEFEADDDLGGYDDWMMNAHDYDVEALDERKFMQLLGECARPD